MVKVKLDDIIDKLEISTDFGNSFLNKNSGEIFFISDEDFSYAEGDFDDSDFIPDWQKENIAKAKEIIETENYLRLPTKYEINEYVIMERFCLSLTNNDLREEMYYSLKGRGAFGRFKDNIHRFNIAEEWYEFKRTELLEIAVDWCKENNLGYI